MGHFDKFHEAKEQLEAVIKSHGEDSIKSFFKEWFEKNPTVHGVMWTQYTPYFNDGEPCEFGLHGVGLFTDKGEFEDSSDPYDGKDVWGDGTLYEELSEIEPILESAFGEDALVKVTRDSIEVTEYSHE